MVNGIRKIYLNGLNKGLGSQVQHKTTDEDQRAHWTKHL